MARKVCDKCGKTTGSYHTTRLAGGKDGRTLCDDCLGTIKRPGKVLA
jgi:hypothetical protein